MVTPILRFLLSFSNVSRLRLYQTNTSLQGYTSIDVRILYHNNCMMSNSYKILLKPRIFSAFDPF